MPFLVAIPASVHNKQSIAVKASHTRTRRIHSLDPIYEQTIYWLCAVCCAAARVQNAVDRRRRCSVQ